MLLLHRHVPVLVLLFTVLLCGEITSVSANGETGQKRPSILERRPCGPDFLRGPLRYLLFQGCAGADFRPACVRHDACYDTVGLSKDYSDQVFLKELLEACKDSKLPGLARYRANIAYLGVRYAGHSAWHSAQDLARRKANGEVIPAVTAVTKPFARWFTPGSRRQASGAPSITK